MNEKKYRLENFFWPMVLLSFFAGVAAAVLRHNVLAGIATYVVLVCTVFTVTLCMMLGRDRREKRR